MNIRTIAISAAALGVLGYLVYRSEDATTRKPVANKVTVLYWEKWTGDEAQKMRRIVNNFNASQDRIYVKMLSISGVADKTLLAASGGNPPDVAGLWDTQMTQFKDAGALTDLAPLAAEFGIKEEDYIPGYWKLMSPGGTLVAFPTTPASTALHINKKFLKPGEVPPQTLEELDAFTDRISKVKDGKVELAGFMPAEPGWWNWGWGYWFGGKLIDGDKLTINSPENIRAFEWVLSYSKRFGVRETQNFQSGFGNFSSPQNPFMSEKVVSVMQGVWMANFIDLYNKELPWIAVPFPLPKDQQHLKGMNFIAMDTLVIPTGAKHKREAFEFIAFVQRQDQMELLCSSHGKNSPLVKVTDKFFNTHLNPYIRLFDELARSPNAAYIPQIGIWPQMDSELKNAFTEINLGTKSPKEALDAAQARLDPQWRRYQQQVMGRSITTAEAKP